jgi:hypothetical protein
MRSPSSDLFDWIVSAGVASILAALAVACSGNNNTSPSPSSPSATPTRIIGVSPGNLAFGNVQVGNQASLTLTITNTGSSTLTVSGMVVTGGLSSVITASWTSGTIAPGGSQPSTIIFAATTAQTYTGTLTMNGDQTSGTNTIAVSGAGTSPATPSPQCNYTLSIGSTVSGYPNGGSFPVTVTTSTGCQWTASTTTAWIHVPSSASVSGTGPTTFTVDMNLGAARTGSVTIAGQTITFNQDASTSSPSPAPLTCNGSAVPSVVSCLNGDPPGPPTAKCNDGQFSCSQNRSGTCSTHGGVACYVCPGPLC